MIDQIRHLQSRAPFETFSIELANGRIIQIHDRHSVATTDGSRPEEAVIGVLHATGAFEVINSNQVACISVGLHPKVKEHLASRMERVKKMYEGER
jgi:hypothetical protein